MTKKLQKCIYQEGKRITVKTVCRDETHREQICIPVTTVKEGVEILSKIREKDNDYSYGVKLKKEQRVKLGYPVIEKGRGDNRNLKHQNKYWYIVKEINGKRYSWKCETKEEAIKLRNKLEKNEWNISADTVTDAKHNSKRNTYKRFEEVKDFPRIHISRNDNVLPEQTATRQMQKPVNNLTSNSQHTVFDILENKASEYNISLDEMKNLTMMIGLQQIQRLNFIPEWEDTDVHSNI